jgi:hypothetical protein
MSNQVLLFKEKLDVHTNDEGVIFEPVERDNGYIVPIGWEYDLKEMGVEFEVIKLEDESKPNV